MSPVRTWWGSVCLLLAAATSAAQTTLGPSNTTHGWLSEAVTHISPERMMADIVALSSPGYLGRQTGTDQDSASATFVADRLASLRLQRRAPALENQANPLTWREWRQTAPVTIRTIQDHPSLRLNLTHDQPSLKVGADFLPVIDSPSANLQAPIVFVGYGLSDPEHGYDDYGGIEVKNTVVLFLRGKPDGYTGPSAHTDKERLAKKKGAVAYLTATGPLLSPYEARRGITGKPSAFYSTSPEPHRLPGAWISTEMAEAIVQNGVENTGHLLEVQEDMTRRKIPHSRITGGTASLQWEQQSTAGTLHNVAAMIPGSLPETDDTVIIGAHRDHFGHQAGLLFGGADDNASGTAVILEVARILAEAPTSPKRSILFLSFSGEEQGLLGSRLYVTQPIIPLSKTIAMINVDHAGIGNGRLTVGVTGLEKRIAAEAGHAVGLADRLDIYGFFPGGDHVPFKDAGIPTVTVVSAGVHPHFHQPTDTADTINSEVLRNTAGYILALAWQLATAP